MADRAEQQQLQTYATFNGISKAGTSLVVVGEYGITGRKVATQSWTFLDRGVNRAANWVTFADATNGFAVGQDGLILHTVNRGATWTEIQNGLTLDSFYGAEMMGPNKLWVVGDLGVLLHTSNGGVNWVQQSTFTTNSLLSISFANENNGWAVGDLGTLIRTTNGGANWSGISTGVSDVLFGVKFKDVNNGWIAGDNGLIRRTVNGGANWTSQTTNTTAALFYVDFIDLNNGFAAGSNGTILKTTNGGTTWTLQPSGTQRNIYVVSGVSLNSVWAVGDSGLVLHSTNGGASWTSEFPKTGYDIFGLKVLSDSLAWIAGDNSAILSTGRGIVNSIREEGELAAGETTPLGFELYQNYPNPANPSTTIEYRLAVAGRVSLKVFDMLGREVAVLVDQEQGIGQYNYQFSTDNVQLSTGVYIYRLTVNGRSSAKKLIMLQ